VTSSSEDTLVPDGAVVTNQDEADALPVRYMRAQSNGKELQPHTFMGDRRAERTAVAYSGLR
jgi:hypothetical protein